MYITQVDIIPIMYHYSWVDCISLTLSSTPSETKTISADADDA